MPALNERVEMTHKSKTPHQCENSIESSSWTTSFSCYNVDADLSDHAVTVPGMARNNLLHFQVSLKSFPSQSLCLPAKDPLALGDAVSDFDDSPSCDQISV
jgi:hypothetical protein